MKIHNTLTRQTEVFRPINDPEVKLYTCGPTVYDYAQIGNLRAFVFDDTLRRALEFLDYKVKHVMNITDVGHLASDADEGEDKLEKGASREQKTVWEVADFYIKAFMADMKALNVLEPNANYGPHGAYARATDFIPQQIEIIERLLNNGFAYQTDQAIYFDVSKLDDYGKLTGQKLTDKEVGARSDVVIDSAKHSPQDFALWFFKVGRFADHSMSWTSPWGEGFPGWHLECSAIIHATLGEPIDIHTGGVDHIGTHHSNEIAQTEAAFGVKLANYWLHNEHLLVDGQKMSKSLKNFYTLSDVAARGFEPLDLRLLFLQSHYRTQSNFSWESLAAAANLLKKFYAWADQYHQDIDPISDTDIHLLIEKIKATMANDLNTPLALATLIDFMDKGAPDQKLLKKLDDLFGLALANRPDITDDQKKLLDQRRLARNENDWALADELRDNLTKQGLEIMDGPRGQTWVRL